MTYVILLTEYYAEVLTSMADVDAQPPNEEVPNGGARPPRPTRGLKPRIFQFFDRPRWRIDLMHLCFDHPVSSSEVNIFVQLN